MVERFDREHTGAGYLRFGLASGLTLLDCDENYLDRERWSYPLLADELRRWSEKRRDLAMTIGAYGRTASVYNMLSQCERFGLSKDAAKREIEKVATTVKGWREYFRACGASAKDIEYIAPAFLPECFFFEVPAEGSK